MGSSPTPYAALNAVLDEFVGRIRELLAESFIGAYLQGSFAIGGFDTYSDVDFLIVLDGDVTDEELPLLQALHEDVYALASPWAQHLEGSYVPNKHSRDFHRRSAPSGTWTTGPNISFVRTTTTRWLSIGR